MTDADNVSNKLKPRILSSSQCIFKQELVTTLRFSGRVSALVLPRPLLRLDSEFIP